MIVTLTIMDSHECPEYHAVRYCARIAQVFSKKTKYCNFSSGAGSVTRWLAIESTQFECEFEKD